tara:strand:- start:746 stop:1864 length:1119 start_codon:yes stop_codon:yes gene_type:complete
MKKFNLLLLLFSSIIYGQFDLDGQLNFQGNVGLDDDKVLFGGIRYLPELNYELQIDSLKSFTIQLAGNISTSKILNSQNDSDQEFNFSPYRIWARYISKQTEFRLGLQKIDFGSAMLLRPLQWFNEIDPRDPLRLTNGVYGILFRHYFKNNSNIWLWGLYGNEKTRGFDILPSIENNPEYGFRYQRIISNGEIGFSYHNRIVGQDYQKIINPYLENSESRFGFDAKWDLGIGLWFESTYVNRKKNIGDFSNQFLLTLGSDYTFGIGNGLNIIAEHLISGYGKSNIFRQEKTQYSAINASYPLNLSQSFSFLYYHQWQSGNNTFLMNYQYQFDKFVGYLLGYYNPKTQAGIQQNEIINTFAGPGIQLLIVFNH